MYTKVHTATMLGMTAAPVEVEVHIAGGFPAFHIVGLADTAVQESRERIRSAIKNSDLVFPSNSKIVINLAPADVKKLGTGFDLPMAIAMHIAQSRCQIDITKTLFVGELALDGTVRHTAAILPVVLFAREHGYDTVFIPAANKHEVAVLSGITILPVDSLEQAVEHISLGKQIQPLVHTPINTTLRRPHHTDMADIKGQHFVKRALEIAAAGAHNILMSGPPGSGKTLLARTFPSIMPHMTEREAIDVTKIYSVAGLLPQGTSLMCERPFRSPHHSASAVSLVGGGKIPRPGEISLAHRGVLFLDEFPEFPRQVLENLRQPLEDGIVTISRAQGTFQFPAEFTLVASQNPCPCGFATDPERNCTCSPMSIERYQKKISGPMLDRIDLHVEVPRISFDELADKQLGETSESILVRVQAARQRQLIRFEGSSTVANSGMNTREIAVHCALDTEPEQLLKAALERFQLSARSYHRLIKVARTIADLADSDEITVPHIAEAIQYRTRGSK